MEAWAGPAPACLLPEQQVLMLSFRMLVNPQGTCSSSCFQNYRNDFSTRKQVLTIIPKTFWKLYISVHCPELYLNWETMWVFYSLPLCWISQCAYTHWQFYVHPGKSICLLCDSIKFSFRPDITPNNRFSRLQKVTEVCADTDGVILIFIDCRSEFGIVWMRNTRGMVMRNTLWFLLL